MSTRRILTISKPCATGFLLSQGSKSRRHSGEPPELCALVLADRLAKAAGPEVARTWLARVAYTPTAPRDPLGGPLAVDLATRGVLPVESLPAELRASFQRARAAE